MSATQPTQKPCEHVNNHGTCAKCGSDLTGEAAKQEPTTYTCRHGVVHDQSSCCGKCLDVMALLDNPTQDNQEQWTCTVCARHLEPFDEKICVECAPLFAKLGNDVPFIRDENNKIYFGITDVVRFIRAREVDPTPQPANKEQVESRVGEILTRLENTVERSTLARQQGRTGNHRMVHANAMTEIYDLIQAHMRHQVAAARIDEAESFIQARGAQDEPGDADYWVIEHANKRITAVTQSTPKEEE
jgi:hypothetical protein